MPELKKASPEKTYRQILLDSRKQQLRLTATAVERLRITFDAAVESIRQKIEALPAERIGTPWHRAMLQLTVEITDVMNALKADNATLLDVGMVELAQNAADREAEVARLVEAPIDPKLFPEIEESFPLTNGQSIPVKFGRLALGAVERVSTRYYRDGLKLSDRLHKLDVQGRKVIENVITQGIAEQLSARDMAKLLQSRMAEVSRDGLPPPRHVTMRIARTEIRHAHVESHLLSTEQAPGVMKDYIDGIRWNLSLSHSEADVCFRRGTLVETDCGPVPIEYVKPGDSVLTHQSRFRPVTRLYRHTIPAGSMIRLRYRVGRSHTREVVMTPNHPVLTERGWIPADGLRIGDRGIAVPESAFRSVGRRSGDGLRKASSGFAGSGTLERGGIACVQRYDEAPHLLRRKSHNEPLDAHAPIGTPMFAFGTSRLCLSRLSIGDSLRQVAPATYAFGGQQAFATYPAFGYRSWGFRFQSALLSGTLAHKTGFSPWTGLLSRRLRTYGASPHEQLGSKPENRTPGLLFFLIGRLRTPFDRLRKLGFAAFLAPSIERHNSWNRTVSSLADSGTCSNRSSREVSRTTRREECDYSYINFTLQQAQIVAIDRISTLGETVYNLEVEEDHSYMAGGLAVHNCDLYATRDSGAGPGIYQRAEYPTSHPHCLCYSTTVLKAFPESGIGGAVPDPDNVPDSQRRRFNEEFGVPARELVAV